MDDGMWRQLFWFCVFGCLLVAVLSYFLEIKTAVAIILITFSAALVAVLIIRSDRRNKRINWIKLGIVIICFGSMGIFVVQDAWRNRILFLPIVQRQVNYASKAIEDDLATDSRFSNVNVYHNLAKPTLTIEGEVENVTAFSDLKVIVARYETPVHISFMVRIGNRSRFNSTITP